MDAEQRYHFGTFGFLVIPAVIGPAAVAELLAVSLKRGPQLHGSERRGGILHWSRQFRDLLDLPILAPILEEICGDRSGAFPSDGGLPTFRVDHINVHTPGAFGGSADDSAEHGTDGGRLHGTATETIYFKEERGVFHSGLTSVTFELEDTMVNTVAHTGGGFCCLPGSHVRDGPAPPSWINLSEGVHPMVHGVPAKAGVRTCLIVFAFSMFAF